MRRLGRGAGRRHGQGPFRKCDTIGQEAWVARYQYSLRWMIEYVFSAVKRTMGSELRSRRRDLMLSEAEGKFWTWNEVRRMDLIN